MFRAQARAELGMDRPHAGEIVGRPLDVLLNRAAIRNLGHDRPMSKASAQFKYLSISAIESSPEIVLTPLTPVNSVHEVPNKSGD